MDSLDPGAQDNSPSCPPLLMVTVCQMDSPVVTWQFPLYMVQTVDVTKVRHIVFQAPD